MGGHFYSYVYHSRVVRIVRFLTSCLSVHTDSTEISLNGHLIRFSRDNTTRKIGILRKDPLCLFVVCLQKDRVYYSGKGN